MFVRTFFLALALIAFPLIVAAADGRPENEAAVDDAFAISMYNPHFVAAAKAGKAHEMRVILVGNGAPTDFRLTAQGMSVESTHGTPVPSQYPTNDGPCIQWRLVVWRSSIPPYGYYSIWVCLAIMDDGVMTYDAR